MTDLYNTKVSYFKSVKDIENPYQINIIDFLTSSKHKDKVEQFRQTGDKTIKEGLPVITPSGMFHARKETGLIKHSGLISIDIDFKGNNLQIDNWTDVKDEVSKIKNIAFTGLSASGNGFWGLIPIKHPDKHKQHFEEIEDFFFKYGLEIDPAPKNVASARFYSYDSEAYLNYNAIAFSKYKEVIYHIPEHRQYKTNNSKALDTIINRMTATQEGQRHNARLKAGFFVGGLISGGQLDEGASQELISAYLNQYGSIDNTETQKKEIKAIEDGIQEGKQRPIYNDQQTPSKPKRTLSFNQYLTGLHFEKDVLITSEGYPATWDYTVSYIDQKTKDTIKKIEQNPQLLSAIKVMQLEKIN